MKNMKIDNYNKLNDVLECISLNENEKSTIKWLSGCEPDTVNNIVSILQKIKKCG